MTDGQLIRPQQDALLNAYILRCVDCYYVIINLKHNGMSNLKISRNHIDGFTSIQHIQYITSHISRPELGPTYNLKFFTLITTAT